MQRDTELQNQGTAALPEPPMSSFRASLMSCEKHVVSIGVRDADGLL